MLSSLDIVHVSRLEQHYYKFQDGFVQSNDLSMISIIDNDLIPGEEHLFHYR